MSLGEALRIVEEDRTLLTARLLRDGGHLEFVVLASAALELKSGLQNVFARVGQRDADWNIGTASGTTYVCDGDGIVRTTAGTEQVDWTWDGEVLLDANGDPVEVQ